MPLPLAQCSFSLSVSTLGLLFPCIMSCLEGFLWAGSISGADTSAAFQAAWPGGSSSVLSCLWGQSLCVLGLPRDCSPNLTEQACSLLLLLSRTAAGSELPGTGAPLEPVPAACVVPLWWGRVSVPHRCGPGCAEDSAQCHLVPLQAQIAAELNKHWQRLLKGLAYYKPPRYSGGLRQDPAGGLLTPEASCTFDGMKGDFTLLLALGFQESSSKRKCLTLPCSGA